MGVDWRREIGFDLRDVAIFVYRLQFLEVAVEKSLGPEAVGFDAGEYFVGGIVKQGVGTGGGGEFGFEAMAAVDIPGSEDQLLELGLFCRRVGAEFFEESGG